MSSWMMVEWFWWWFWWWLNQGGVVEWWFTDGWYTDGLVDWASEWLRMVNEVASLWLVTPRAPQSGWWSSSGWLQGLLMVVTISKLTVDAEEVNDGWWSLNSDALLMLHCGNQLVYRWFSNDQGQWKKWTTNDQQPTTIHQLPTTNYQPPTTNKWQQPTGNKKGQLGSSVGRSSTWHFEPHQFVTEDYPLVQLVTN